MTVFSPLIYPHACVEEAVLDVSRYGNLNFRCRIPANPGNWSSLGSVRSGRKAPQAATMVCVHLDQEVLTDEIPDRCQHAVGEGGRI